MRLNPSAFVQPHCLSPGVATGHIPFGAWLIEALKPRVLVELGTFHGESYLAYCQTVSECNLRTKCFAAGPWRVADRPIEFQDDIFQTLNRQNAAYSGFSRLVRAGYAAAARQFDDGSVDLLHLPKDADFEALEEVIALWQPKLSPDGVVLIQGIDATQPQRAKFWETLSRGRPSFEFKHHKGLGVLFFNASTQQALGLEDSGEQVRLTELLFDRLTFAIENQSAHDWTKLELELTAIEVQDATRRLHDAEQARDVLANDIRELARAHAMQIARLHDEAEVEQALKLAQIQTFQQEAEKLQTEITRQSAENTSLYTSLSEARSNLAETRVSLESALRNLGESEAGRVALEAQLAQFWARVGASLHVMGKRLQAVGKLPARMRSADATKRPLLTRYLIEPSKLGWRNADDR